jgi:hypothetical protein
LRHHADVLLLAGDLSARHSRPGPLSGRRVRDLGLPVIAVVGNHDHLTGRAAATVAAALTDAGVHLLDETGTVLTVDRVRLGVAGAMGFGGGFDPSRTDKRADRFAAALAGLDCDIRVALTHYAPTVATLPANRACTVLGGAALAPPSAAATTWPFATPITSAGTPPRRCSVRSIAYPLIGASPRPPALDPDHLRVVTVGHDRAAPDAVELAPVSRPGRSHDPAHARHLRQARPEEVAAG